MVWEGRQPLQKHVARRPSSATPGGQWKDEKAHSTRSLTSRHQRFSTHSAHSTSLRILCAPSPAGGGQEKILAGKKALPRSRIPVPPPLTASLLCKVLTLYGPAGVGEYRISVSRKWRRAKRADGRAPAGGACC